MQKPLGMIVKLTNVPPEKIGPLHALIDHDDRMKMKFWESARLEGGFESKGWVKKQPITIVRSLMKEGESGYVVTLKIQTCLSGRLSKDQTSETTVQTPLSMLQLIYELLEAFPISVEEAQ